LGWELAGFHSEITTQVIGHDASQGCAGGGLRACLPSIHRRTLETAHRWSVRRSARATLAFFIPRSQYNHSTIGYRRHAEMSTSTRHESYTLAQAISAPLAVEGAWPLDRAYQYCERLARSHYENFPVGSALVPKRLRKHFYSIYAFARIADDFADEGYGEGYTERERLELLVQWRVMLIESFAGRATHPVFVALADTQARFDLPAELFEDLLSAFEQDVTLRRYEGFDQLLDYCRRSANPIGRLILLLFGYPDEQRHRWSDDICTALQLANHWQDVAIDLDKDRVYLPDEDLARFGLAADDLTRSRSSGSFRRLMKFEVERTREMFARGKPLCTSVSGRLGIELRAVWLGGMRILERIEQNNYDVFAHRPVITSTDKLRILPVAASKAAFRRY
jgi:hydroxysqualene synthase